MSVEKSRFEFDEGISETDSIEPSIDSRVSSGVHAGDPLFDKFVDGINAARSFQKATDLDTEDVECPFLCVQESSRVSRDVFKDHMERNFKSYIDEDNSRIIVKCKLGKCGVALLSGGSFESIDCTRAEI